MMCLFFLIFAGMNKINKDRYLCLILWSSFILLGCKNYSIEKKLSTVDTLLAADNLNEAEFTLRQISEKDMSESELAKYNLLSILTTWRLSQPIKNETDLDKSISTYSSFCRLKSSLHSIFTYVSPIQYTFSTKLMV